MNYETMKMFVNIKNGQLAKRDFILCNKSKISENILEFLWREGYIINFKIVKNNAVEKLKIFLKYEKNKPVINSIKFISTPGTKIYYPKRELLKINSHNSLIIISTNLGLKTLQQCKKEKKGGQIQA